MNSCLPCPIGTLITVTTRALPQLQGTGLYLGPDDTGGTPKICLLWRGRVAAFELQGIWDFAPTFFDNRASAASGVV